MKAVCLMESGSYRLLLLLLGHCLALIEGELRCYCNESGCVATGYMCKSSAGQCYTAVEVQGEHTRATHGCLDMVPLEHRGTCGSDVLKKSADEGSRQERQNLHNEQLVKQDERLSPGSAKIPLLICCGDDMCNYIENIDFSSIVMTPKANGSSQKGAVGGEKGVIYSKQPEEDSAERDLWFKAAVIAVPIAGGFILVLLVLLAVRMLRTDTQRHRRLIQIRRERSLTKAQLYVTDHFSDAGAKSDVSKPCSFFSPKPYNGVGKNAHVSSKVLGMNVGLGTGGVKPVCRDVNITVDKEGRIYEKMCDVTVHRHSQHPSLVKWGNPSLADHATVV